jgi:hypothetical protein
LGIGWRLGVAAARCGVAVAGERDAAERYSEPSLFTVVERSR